jgi:hypothetical protein
MGLLATLVLYPFASQTNEALEYFSDMRCCLLCSPYVVFLAS